LKENIHSPIKKMSIKHQIATYTLNEDGTIPDFVLGGKYSIGGFLPIYNGGISPQDHTMLCLTSYPVSEQKPKNIYQILETKDDLNTYLIDYFNKLDESFRLSLEDKASINDHLEYIWNKYEKANRLIEEEPVVEESIAEEPPQ